MMIHRRALAAGIRTKITAHSFRATGITTYLQNGGKLEVAQQMAGPRIRPDYRPLRPAQRFRGARRGGENCVLNSETRPHRCGRAVRLKKITGPLSSTVFDPPLHLTRALTAQRSIRLRANRTAAIPLPINIMLPGSGTAAVVSPPLN